MFHFPGLPHRATRENPKFEILNPKWFDRLTILSEAEGQIQNYNFQNSKHFYFGHLDFGNWNLFRISILVLRISVCNAA